MQFSTEPYNASVKFSKLVMTDSKEPVAATSSTEDKESGIGSSVASSEAGASNEHLQTNPPRIIHMHSNSMVHRRLSSPDYSPPVQHFRRAPRVMEYENFPPPSSQVSPNKPVGGIREEEDVKEKAAVEAKCQSWLLRLFESKMFDASMAIHYLFNSKEPGVLGYLGNRLFTLDDDEVGFYLPQLVNMYIQHHEVAEVIHPYLVHRCRNSVDFSLQCAWLLEAFTPASSEGFSKKHRSHGTKLKNLVLSGELVPKDSNQNGGAASTSGKKPSNAKLIVPNGPSSQHSHRRTHMRSRSDATGLLISANGK